MIRILALFLVCLSLSTDPGEADVLSGLARVVDGDTLELGGERVRLFGIDAPEIDQTCERRTGTWPCGRWAREQLRDVAKRGTVTCQGDTRDRYGRLLARCTVEGDDIGALVVRAGAAEAYRRYSSEYVTEEKQAVFAGLGLWQGRLQAPEAFRAAERQEAAASNAPGPQGCTIKGNISGSGRIYHLPGQENYDDTRIDAARGERWFCSEPEARAAGWRRAKR